MANFSQKIVIATVSKKPQSQTNSCERKRRQKKGKSSNRQQKTLHTHGKVGYRDRNAQGSIVFGESKKITTQGIKDY
jgi:hypothetical protein